ncbi:M20 family metallo-hydrolase [Marinilongibacter aquaticus]|uniref:M20 family metallo-hydrolase n=1 Tax=Marinilongibacter aquaticus TaxID=2975157 RepID=UPI0021BDE1F0|nr:M20 family metallo-hydrolase [Marinilongibacter aquaticus]UBM60644.1 M20 family metallo-hydrolase [Marinilongibacter aquaticus]
MKTETHLAEDAIALLKKLIAQPSFSREEEGTAYILEEYFRERNIPFSRLMNNVWAKNAHFDKAKPTVLLNSHHDTVKPNASYSRDPFAPTVEDDKLYGLGSNDAGGPLVALLAAFTHFYYRPDLPFNLVLAATAEEEVSGKHGIEALLPKLPKLDFGIVGEPTSLDLAVAEKGLLVLDCYAYGKPGHAARDEGENAITKALIDMQWFAEYEFAKVSDTLGKMKMSLTVIEAGTQHNVVPDRCKMTVDVRVTDAYTLDETLEIIKENVSCEVVPRSVRLNSSGVSKEHPVWLVAKEMGLHCYGSPTLSDQALMPFETVKFGPGDSARSHSADEFIHLSQIREGVDKYVELLERMKMHFESGVLA